MDGRLLAIGLERLGLIEYQFATGITKLHQHLVRDRLAWEIANSNICLKLSIAIIIHRSSRNIVIPYRHWAIGL